MEALLPEFANSAIKSGLTFVYDLEPLVAPTVVLGRSGLSDSSDHKCRVDTACMQRHSLLLGESRSGRNVFSSVELSSV